VFEQSFRADFVDHSDFLDAIERKGRLSWWWKPAPWPGSRRHAGWSEPWKQPLRLLEKPTPHPTDCALSICRVVIRPGTSPSLLPVAI